VLVSVALYFLPFFLLCAFDSAPLTSKHGVRVCLFAGWCVSVRGFAVVLAGVSEDTESTP
jgi:hypothetical protein